MAKNYNDGDPQIPPHQHNGNDSLQINSVNVLGFSPIPSGNKKYTGINNVGEFGFASPQILQTPAYELQGNTNALYTLPIIFSNNSSSFQGGYAPEGTTLLFIDPTITDQAQLWALLEGIWYGVDLSTSPVPPTPSTYGLSGMQTFTASGTFTVPAGITKVWVRQVGGGQGGSHQNTSGGSASPGSAGDYSEDVVDLTGIPTVSVTIGAGGAGGASGGAAGTNGGDTTFGSYILSKGGNSGSTSTGTVIITPYSSQSQGMILAATGTSTNFTAVSAGGQGTPFGLGGVPAFGTPGSNAAGNAGQGYGSSGSGGASGNSGGTAAGGSGKDGVLIVLY